MTANEYWGQIVEELLTEQVVSDGKREFFRMPCDVLVFHSAPFVTLRKTSWRNALRELEWLAYGNGALRNLHASCQHWWRSFANKDGIVEGVGFDMSTLLNGVRDNPTSRRNILTSFHTPYSKTARNDFVLHASTYNNALDLFVYQRACDVGRGAMHNWLQYWAIGIWLAHHTGYSFNRLLWTSGDVHLYKKHASVLGRCVNPSVPVPPAPNFVYKPSWKEFFVADDFSLDSEYQASNTEPLEWV